MYTARLRKVGGSVMLAIPPALLELLDLAPKASVDLSVEDGRLVVAPTRRRRYTLAELLADCDGAAPRPERDEAWLEAPPAGDEII